MAESAVARLGALARGHAEMLMLGALLVGAVVFGGALPAGVYGLGVAAGCLVALQAMGLVLVYRSSRIINFAQIPMGVAAGVVFQTLVQRRAFLLGLRAICNQCVPLPGDAHAYLNAHPAIAALLPSGATPDQVAVQLAAGWLVDLNYWLSMAAGLLLALGVIALMYVGVVRRFAHAPRLVLTIATIAIGQVALIFPALILGWVLPSGPSVGAAAGQSGLQMPLPLGFTAGGVVFSAAQTLSVVALAVAGVALYRFLKHTPAGIALRATGENAQRAQTIGINVTGVGFQAWMLAGLLSIVASLVQTASGFTSDLSYQALVVALAAALAGGLVRLPQAAIGGLGVGVITEILLYHLGAEAYLPVLLLGVIIAMLLVQRARARRADVEADASYVASREVRPTPAELRDLPAVRRTRFLLSGLGILLLGAFPWVMSAGQVTLGTSTMAAGMVGLSLLVLTGWAGQISLGQMAFAAVGGWVAAMSGWPMPFAILAGGLAGAIAAVIVGLPALRLRGLHLAIITLAVGIVAEQILLSPHFLGANLPTQLPRPVLLGIDFGDGRSYFYLTAIVLALTVAGVVGMRRSRLGRTLIAARDNEQAVQAFGVNLVRARLSAFAISGFIAATAGGVFAYAVNGVPVPTFSAEQGVDMFLFAVIGGLGSVSGPLLGVAWFGLVAMLSQGPLASVLSVVGSPGLGVIAVLLLFPGGFSQLWFGLRDAWLRRVADRHRIVVPSLVADRALQPGEGLPIHPNVTDSGGTAEVPRRYRLQRQWMVDSRRAVKVDG